MYYATCSLKLLYTDGIETLLGNKLRYHLPFINPEAYIGWGYKKHSLIARDKASKNSKDFYYIEDGFLRSLYPSHLSRMPLSIIKDKNGLYFDYKARTNLEKMIYNSNLSPDEDKEAEDGIAFFKKHRLSKYCIGGDPYNDLCPKGFDTDSILLIDQTMGDASLYYGGITEENLSNIIEEIIELSKGKKIFLKTHPDVIAGKKKSCFSDLLKNINIKIIDDGVALSTLFLKKPTIMALTSLAGFESLLYGCETHVFGIPWYAGYGLTVDHNQNINYIKNYRPNKNIKDLFFYAYIKYPIYFDPATLKIGNFWDVAVYLARCCRHVRDMSGDLNLVGFRWWKRRDIKSFVKTPFNKVRYYNGDIKDTDKSKILVWGYKHPEIIKKHPNVKVIRVEDGFIRSYGLGADFIPPFSLVFDKKNLYYYHSKENPSEIKTYIKSDFLPYQKSRLSRLLDNIKVNKITKYNLGDNSEINRSEKKPILLVIGQVEKDASLKYGCLPKNINCNMDMLIYAKENFPNHYIIYKVHPDIIRGHHHEKITDETYKYVDEIETKSSILSLFNISDHILCMTSLSGFEALMRNKKVTILGEPFYKNHKNIYDLAYGSLIEYPIYINTDNINLPYGTPERTINKIISQKNKRLYPLRYLHIKSHFVKRAYQIKKWIFG